MPSRPSSDHTLWAICEQGQLCGNELKYRRTFTEALERGERFPSVPLLDTDMDVILRRADVVLCFVYS